MTLREQSGGPSYPDVAADLAALAALLDQQGKCGEAEHLYRRALTIFRRFYSAAPYEVAVTLNNLAALYKTTSRPAWPGRCTSGR